MNPARWLYRVWQFWHALTARPTPKALDHIQTILNPEQFALFTRLQASEQAHAFNVLVQLDEQGYDNQDLLVAALLHDIGKARYPLHIWERVLIVLAYVLFPNSFDEWGNGAPRGWRRAFVIAAQHPAWGAAMATETGTSDITLEIIRRHQEDIDEPNTEVEKLILLLQVVDDAN